MPNTHQTSKHKWRREKFWAFMLLGLNRVLNHDFLPPWGFEFLLRVNAQAWWYYSHYGFGARTESQDYGDQADGEPLSDEVSVGEQPTRRKQNQQQKPQDGGGGIKVLRPRRSRGDISKSLSTSADTEPHENRPSSSPRRNYAHTGDPYGGFSDSDVPRRPLKCRFPELHRTPAPRPHGCTCTPEVLRTLWCMCRSEAAEGLDLLPKFEWEEDNGEHSSRDPL